MASYSATSTPSLKSYDIIHINRVSNTQTFRVARAFRNTYRPKYHAKTLARKLNLCVRIDLALKLDPKQISTIPLPVLETPPPSPEPHPQQQQQAPAPLELEPGVEISCSVVGREREMKRLARPILRCEIPRDVRVKSPSLPLSSSASTSSSQSSDDSACVPVIHAPQALRGQNVPWRLVTSCWSASTVDGSENEGETALDLALALDNTSSYSFDSDREDDVGVPRSSSRGYEADGDGVSPREAAGSGLHSGSPHTAERIGLGTQMMLPLKLDLGRISWGMITSGGSPLSSSSIGPVTPEDNERTLPNLVIRSKRSSPFDDNDVDVESIEKRPKYDRKSWIDRARRTVKKSIRIKKA